MCLLDENHNAYPLKDLRTFKHCSDAVTDIVFSPNGLYMATADADRCVGLFRYYHRDEETDKPIEWIYVGKFRSHYKPITSIRFSTCRRQTEKVDDDEDDRDDDEDEDDKRDLQLFSLGEDRILHEYDIAQSSIRAGVKVKNSTKVDQVAVPTAMVCIPGRPVLRKEDEDELFRQGDENKKVYTPDLMVTANDEYKLKVT